ncbi:MAG: phosphate acyltransferase PlsX [Chloroflexota bacterium]|nr:phosphate acyltransferase PlsX [Chloroflexota bacterium]
MGQPAATIGEEDVLVNIAVDAAGGDHGPGVVVPGAIAGARRAGVGLILTGPEGEVRAALAAVDAGGVAVSVVDAPESIAMDEPPAQAVRRKPRSSIVVAMNAVKDGSAAAMISAGNSGAVMAAALLVLGRVPGIDRPAIAGFIPTREGRCLLLDLGAVTDPKPDNLVQFARMGSLYVERVRGVARPRVGLLSNGAEAAKGNQLVRDVYPLLAATPGVTFIGNIEGNDLTRGVADVVVTDGFTGNVALKVAEGVATFVGDLLRAEVTATPPRKLAALLLRPAFGALRSRLDYAETGGAPLLGVNGIVIIAHGRSNQTAIANAVAVAKQSADHDVTSSIATLAASDGG